MSELRDDLIALYRKMVVADMLPEAVTVGGPRDGESFGMPRGVEEHFLLPVQRGIIAALEGVERIDAERPPVPMAVYELAHLEGHPSRDDQGRYRYMYAGERRQA